MTPPHKKKSLVESANFYQNQQHQYYPYSGSSTTSSLTTTTTPPVLITSNIQSTLTTTATPLDNDNDSTKRMRVAENNSTLSYCHYLQQLQQNSSNSSSINNRKLLETTSTIRPHYNTVPTTIDHYYHHNHYHQQQANYCYNFYYQPQSQQQQHYLHQNNLCLGYSNNSPSPSTSDMYFFSSKSDNSEFSQKKCRNFFRQYAEHDSESIGPDGIEKLCQDLGVRPEEAIVLALSWKLNAKVMGIYTFDEWIRGMSELKCDNINKLKNKLPYLKSCLDDNMQFRSIFRYSYEFAKEPEQRCIDIETAKQMLTVLFQQRWPLLQLFTEFLSQSHYRVINKDQYYNILDFFYSVNCDLTNYDENGAWPVMLDEFVEWCRAKKGFKRVNNNASVSYSNNPYGNNYNTSNLHNNGAH